MVMALPWLRSGSALAMQQQAATAKDMAKAAKDAGMEEQMGGALNGAAQN